MIKLQLRRQWSLSASVLVAGLLVTLVVASAAQAATTFTVCGGGCNFTTIQAAIDAASSGDTIDIAAGTYDEPGHVTINGFTNLTITGAGQSSTTINTNVVGGSASHTYGVLIEASQNVTLQDLTVIGPDAANSGGGHGTGYGLHDDDSDHVSLINVTIENSARSNLDFNGADFVTLTNVTATGAVYGNGISLSDTNDVSINGITTSGNAWGGIALYATGGTYPCGVNNVSIANASISDLDAVYTGIDNVSGHGSACTISNVTVDPTELPYEVTVNQGATGDPRDIYVASFADATSVISQLSPPSTSTPVIRSTADGSLSNDADLTSLSLSNGTLAPVFSSSATSYTASVDNSVSNVNVSSTASAGAAIVASGGSNLAVGNNAVTITVTAADGTTTKTYTVVVNRAAPAPATTTATTTTTTPTTTTTTPTTPPPTTTPAAPAVNQPSAPTAATPNQSGSVSISVGAATTTSAPGVVRIATLTEPVEPVTVGASWPIGTFTTPVTVQMTPMPELASTPITGGSTSSAGVATTSPIAGGFSVGATVFQLTVTDAATGSPVTSFAAPIVFHVSALGPGQVPAYSHDGASWTQIPLLSSPELPATQPDGYFVYADGSADIFTRHATFFGLLVDTQAPTTPKLKIRVENAGLRLSISGARDNIRVGGYVVSRNGHGYKATKRTSIVLPLEPGAYVVRALDTSGNVSGPSAAVTIVRTPGAHPSFTATP